MEGTRTKEELTIIAGLERAAGRFRGELGLWEERWSQSPFFSSSGRLKIAAGNRDFGQVLQSWIVFARDSEKAFHSQRGSE